MKLVLNKTKTCKRYCNFSVIDKSFRNKFLEYINHNKNTMRKKDSTLISEFDAFVNYTMPFLLLKKIKSINNMNGNIIREFTSYLNTSLKENGEVLSNSNKRNIFLYFKSFVIWIERHYNIEKPVSNLFIPNPFSRGKTLSIKTKPIEDKIINQFKSALIREKNIYIKCSITLALYQGLRLEDILELREDCLIEDNDSKGKYNLRYYNNKSDMWVEKRIFNPVDSVLLELINETAELRKISKDNRIFIHEHDNKIMRYSSRTPNQWIQKFIKKHKIVNDNGKYEKINIHKFRSSLLTKMDSQGIDVEIAAHIADHKNSATTLRYYIHTTNEDYNKNMDLLDTIVNSITITEEMTNVVNIKSKSLKNKLRLDSGYCQDPMMLNDKTYICEHYKNKGNCYGCSKMITTPEFLTYFYELLDEKEIELVDKKQYSKHLFDHINFEISLIKELIKKIEKVKREVID